MAYYKEQHLRDNIEGIKLAFIISKEKVYVLSNEERTILRKYSGFGGIKAVPKGICFACSSKNKS